MTFRELHPWDLAPAEARKLQEELAGRVELRDRFGPVHRIAGVDIGFEDDGRTTRAAVAVLDAKTLELVEHAIARQPTRFPYIPGLLSFREIPAALAALDRLARPPDLLLCDGQGYAHPRRFGLACHLGLLTDLPSLGVAKSRFIGQHEETPTKKGDWSPLLDDGEVIGAVLCTRDGVKPVYVSTGHRVSLGQAITFTLGACTRFRLPETTRWADRLSRRDL